MELHWQITESEMDDLEHGRTISQAIPLDHVNIATKNGRRSKRVAIIAGNVGKDAGERALFLNLKLESPSNG